MRYLFTAFRCIRWRFFILMTSLSLLARLPATAQTWQEATSFGEGITWGTTVDAAGNVYVTGFLFGTGTFGTITIQSSVRGSAFVAKRSSAGVWLWAVRTTGNRDDTGRGIAVDALGNVFVVGTFKSSSINFGNITLTNRSSSGIYTDMFVAKLNSSGVWRWAVRGGGGNNDDGTEIRLDSTGNVYISGSYNGPATFGTTTLTNLIMDHYVAKLSPAGAWQWVVAGGGGTGEPNHGMTADPAGNVYVAGSFTQGSTVFGNITLVNTNRGADVYVAKLDPTGNWVWAVSTQGDGEEYSYAVAVDAAGYLTIAGQTRSPVLTLGTITLATLTTPNFSDMFIARLTPTGAWQWAVQVGGTRTDAGVSLAIDAASNSYVSCRFTSPSVTWGTTTVTNNWAGNTFDSFIGKIDAGGNMQWAVGAGGSSDDDARQIALSPQGDIYVAGYYDARASFGPFTLTNNFTYYGSFLARLSNPPVGLAEDDAQPGGGLRIAPNPATDVVRISGAPIGTAVTLLDAVGRTVRTWRSSANEPDFDLRGLPAGVYVVRAGQLARRLVVE